MSDSETDGDRTTAPVNVLDSSWSKRSSENNSPQCKASLSVAARRCFLSKAMMLFSQFTSTVNQLNVVCNLLKDLKGSEAEDYFADIQTDFINLVTIEKKIFQMSDYARSVRVHQLPRELYSQLTRNRLSTLYKLEEGDNSPTFRTKRFTTDWERYQEIFKVEDHLWTKPSFGRRLVNKYSIKEKSCNYRMVLAIAIRDHRILDGEITAINCYLFGLNNKKHMKESGEVPQPNFNNQTTPLFDAVHRKSGASRVSLSMSSVLKSANEGETTCTSPISYFERTEAKSCTEAAGLVEDKNITTLSKSDPVVNIPQTRFRTKVIPGVKLLGNSFNWYIRNKLADGQDSSAILTEDGSHGDTATPPDLSTVVGELRTDNPIFLSETVNRASNTLMAADVNPERKPKESEKVIT